MTKPLLPEGLGDASDLELARRVAAGDQAAFQAIMQRHNRVPYRMARAILRDDAEAEDALQEAYLQAYRNMDSYRGKARLSTWLARVVANEALMRLRKQTRRPSVVPLHLGFAVANRNDITEGSMATGPEALARRAEMRKLLEQHIDGLPVAYRAVFMLRAVEEYSVEETAAILAIPEATVRSRFFRARSLLREGLTFALDIARGDAFDFAGERCDRVVARVMQRLAYAGASVSAMRSARSSRSR